MVFEKEVQQIDVIKIIKLRYLHQRIKDYGLLKMSKGILKNIPFLENFSSYKILNTADPFFWYNLDRIFLANKDEQKFIPLYCNFFSVSFFDCFFQMLPIGYTIEFNSKMRKELILPNLGLKVKELGNIKSLKKYSQTIISVCTLSNEKLYNLNDEKTFKKDNVSGIESLFVPIDINFCIFDNRHYKNPKISIKERKVFVESLSISTGLIKEYFYGEYINIINLINWVIFLKSENIYSFTDIRLKNTIYISYTKDYFNFASIIIHEYSHLELETINENTQLFFENEKLFYSPWRQDMRPIRGLFHATYVFSKVYVFLSKAKNNLSEIAKFNRYTIYHQLLIALKIIDFNCLTEAGNVIIKKIQSDLLIYSETEMVNSTAPNYVIDHFNSWDKTRSNNNEIISSNDSV